MCKETEKHFLNFFINMMLLWDSTECLHNSSSTVEEHLTFLHRTAAEIRISQDTKETRSMTEKAYRWEKGMQGLMFKYHENGPDPHLVEINAGPQESMQQCQFTPDEDLAQ
ncbi:hypothetical protein BTVI_12063 [Pitangus sulphuratus]|nr:hypothetical protein BTVI_12063 [Pitangus sulphuratus]